MRAVKCVLLLLAGFSLMNWIRGGTRFHPAETLPFLGGGHRPNALYEIAGIYLCAITVWGVMRLQRRDRG